MPSSDTTLPLRLIVESYSHKDGAFHVLECGHHVEANRAATKRRCPRCPPIPRRPKRPTGPVALRQWMVDHYGWTNKSAKDIGKLSGWCIDDLGVGPRRKVYPTDCPLHVQVEDDTTLLLFVGNDDIRTRIGPQVRGAESDPRGFALRFPFDAALHLIANAVDSL